MITSLGGNVTNLPHAKGVKERVDKLNKEKEYYREKAINMKIAQEQALELERQRVRILQMNSVSLYGSIPLQNRRRRSTISAAAAR
jgi:hypothetical protein